MVQSDISSDAGGGGPGALGGGVAGAVVAAGGGAHLDIDCSCSGIKELTEFGKETTLKTLRTLPSLLEPWIDVCTNR